VAAYRIASEALTNAVRHSGARSIGVTLAGGPAGCEVVVADDGVGFDAGSAPAVPDGGLALARRRAQLAGGRIEVRSTPGAGTTVEIVLPASW